MCKFNWFKPPLLLAPPSRTWMQVESRLDWILDPDSQGAPGPLGDFRRTPGSPSVFSAVSPGAPYVAAYWYNVLDNIGEFSSYKDFHHELSVQVSDISACQAIEFELQLCVSGLVYNMAWQAEIGKYWRSFDYASSDWEATGVPVDASLMVGRFCPIMADFHINPDDSISFTRLTVNEVVHDLVVSHKSVQDPKIPVTESYLHTGFQLDTNSKAAPYNVQVQNINIQVSK